jgi:hypothetical protein
VQAKGCRRLETGIAAFVRGALAAEQKTFGDQLRRAVLQRGRIGLFRHQTGELRVRSLFREGCRLATPSGVSIQNDSLPLRLTSPDPSDLLRHGTRGQLESNPPRHVRQVMALIEEVAGA